jgi:energy-coupling factor transporter ATP-binding protein EcfA2
LKIRRVTTDGVRGVADRLYDFTHRRSTAAASIVLLTGPSGSGKTSLLDAIAAAKEDVAPWGARHSWSRVVRSGATAAKIRVEWEIDDEERRRLGFDASVVTSESIFSPTTPPGQGHDPRLEALLERYDHDPKHGKMEYFFAERTLATEAIGLSILDPSIQKRVRLDRDLRKYGALHKYLHELHLGLHERQDEPAGRERFAATFAKLCPSRRVLGLVRTTDRMELVFDGGGDGAIPIARLPHAEQQAVLFAATFELLGLNRSVVLVDGPELHQTVAATPTFARAVAGLGADNQFVFATGAPSLSEAFPDCVTIDLGAAAR